MIHTIKCTICKTTQKVNGQKQIDTFRENHTHDKGILACNHLELDKPQDDKPFNTGSNVNDVHDYWAKISRTLYGRRI